MIIEKNRRATQVCYFINSVPKKKKPHKVLEISFQIQIIIMEKLQKCTLYHSEYPSLSDLIYNFVIALVAI